MTTDAGLSHEQAHAFLHTGRRQLSGAQAKQLDAHLAACADCRAYAAYLPVAEPQLAAALHARWDATQPALAEHEFTERVRARSGRSGRQPWLMAVPLTAVLVGLVLAVVMISSGWGLGGPAQQPTEVAPTAPPLPTGIVLGPIPELPSPTPPPAVAADPLARWVAFLVREADNRDAIYVMHLDGSDGRYLVDEAGERYHGRSLAWSPNGAELAFVSDHSGGPEVYQTNITTWAVTRMTYSADYSTYYSIAWLSNDFLGVTIMPAERPADWTGGEIYYLRATVIENPFPAGEPGSTNNPYFAGRVIGPEMVEGFGLTYSKLDDYGLPALYTGRAASYTPGREEAMQQLTPPSDPASGAHDIYLGFSWSPDNTRFAYLRQGPWIGGLNDAQPGEGFHASIEMLTTQTPVLDAGYPLTAEIKARTTLLDLAPSPNGIMGLSWSPDDKYLLYLSDAVTAASLGDGSASSGCWTPRLLPVAGGDPINLAGFCYLTRTALPQWSSDGRYLLLSTETGLALIDVPAAVADPAHVQPTYLPNVSDGLAHSPAWQPRP